MSPWDGAAVLDSINPTGFFKYATIIEVRLSGEVRQVPGILPGYDLRWGPTGTSDHQASMGLMIASSQGSDMWWPRSGITTDTIKVVNTIYGLRSGLNDPQPAGGPTWSCGQYNRVPCWTYEGVAHLDFTRIAAELILTRSGPASMDSGAVVVFTASANPSLIAGRTVDLSNVRWRWASANPSSSDSTACSSGATCTKIMRTPGTMYVSAYVNGVEKSKSMQVRVGRPGNQPCDLPGSPEMSNFTMDTAMKNLWNDSNYSPTTPDVDRREQGGFIIRTIQSTDTSYSFQRFAASGTEPCSISPPSSVPVGTVGWVHTHPWEIKERQTSCGNLTIKIGTQIFSAPVNYNGEASEDDNDMSRIFGETSTPPIPGGLPGYLLDVNGINKFGPAKEPGTRFPRCSF